MAWEKRGNNRYYYTKKWVSGKVVSRYIGNGLEAKRIAYETQERKRARSKERLDANFLEQEIAQVSRLAKNLTEGALLVSGFHKHKGEWRRKRNAR